MRNRFSGLLLIVSIIFVTYSSCTKDTTTTITITPLTKTQILTKYTKWWVYETYQDLSGVVYHYKRGVVNTFPPSANQDPIRFSFKADSTGTYTGPDNLTYNTRWQFTADQNDILMNIYYTSTPTLNTWSLISITDSSFVQTTAIPQGLVSAKLVPAP